MKLTLKIDGKDKTFKPPFISGRKLRKTLELIESGKMDGNDVSALDETVAYIVDIFENQFTEDQFYDGIASKDILPTVTNLVGEIMGKVNESTEGLQDPNE